MNIRTFTERFPKDLSDHKTIVCVAKCEIDYEGRSRSQIGEGDRILLFKPDSTIIIHSPKGFKPVNWMSSPTDTTVDLSGENPVIFSERTVKPFEKIRITILDIISYSGFDSLLDRGKLDLTHTEHDMRDYLADNPHEVHRRFRLKKKEKKTKVGLIDLYGKLGDRYCIVELKSVRAGLPAVLQLKRYRDHMQEELNLDVHAILMAPSCSKNPLEILKKEGMEFKKFNLKKIKLPEPGSNLNQWL